MARLPKKAKKKTKRGIFVNGYELISEHEDQYRDPDDLVEELFKERQLLLDEIKELKKDLKKSAAKVKKLEKENADLQAQLLALREEYEALFKPVNSSDSGLDDFIVKRVSYQKKR